MTAETAKTILLILAGAGTVWLGMLVHHWLEMRRVDRDEERP